LRYIENQLSLRRAAGKAVSLVGLSLGISTAFMTTGCTSEPNNPKISEQPAPIDSPKVIEGMLLPPSDTTSRPASEEPVASVDTAFEEYIEGDVEGDVEIDDYTLEETLGMISYTPDSSDCYTIADEMTEFPGGDVALMNYIKQNLRYPALAGEMGIQGRVTLSFIVERDGSISNIEVMRTPAEELSKEAISLVKSMPKWKPGKIKGTPVRMKYVLPVTFRIE
jgi:protein TonB